jgi:hypothetical protein
MDRTLSVRLSRRRELVICLVSIFSVDDNIIVANRQRNVLLFIVDFSPCSFG